jgi:Tfp pilus assembly protein PilZ
MDEKTGTIFWYNSKNKAREAKWNRLAEDLLLNLTFTPNPQKIDLAGEIAFIFKSNSQAKERSHD